MEPRVVVHCFGHGSGLVAVAEALAGALAPALGLPAEVSEQSLDLPERAYYPTRDQWLASGLLTALKDANPPGGSSGSGPRAPLLLGLTDADLFDTGLNFVFGEASERHGAAVVSLARLDDSFYGWGSADPALVQRRALTEAVHELSHALGLGHCQNDGCVMWFRCGAGALLRRARCQQHACIFLPCPGTWASPAYSRRRPT